MKVSDITIIENSEYELIQQQHTEDKMSAVHNLNHIIINMQNQISPRKINQIEIRQHSCCSIAFKTFFTVNITDGKDDLCGVFVMLVGVR